MPSTNFRSAFRYRFQHTKVLGVLAGRLPKRFQGTLIFSSEACRRQTCDAANVGPLVLCLKCMCNHSHLTEIPNPQKPESRIYVAKTSNAPKWNWVHPIMKLFKSNLDRALFRGHLALQTLNLAAQPHQRWAWKEDLEVPEQVSCVTKAPRAEQISWLPQ